MSANSFSIPSSLKTYVYGDGFMRDGYIVNYTASVKTDAPGTGGEETESPLAGTWDQVVTGMSWPTPSETMTIAVSGTTVTITDFLASGTVAVGTLAENKITIPQGTAIGSGMSSAGSLDSDVVLTVSDNKEITVSSQFSVGGWIYVASYTATKQVTSEPEQGIDPSILVGTWTENYTTLFGPMSYANMTISESDDPAKGQLKIRMFIDDSYGEKLDCYANLSNDGTILTILAKDAYVNEHVKFLADFDMTVADEGKTLSFTGPVKCDVEGYEYSDYTATKNQ